MSKYDTINLMKRHRFRSEIVIFSAFFLLILLPNILAQFFTSSIDAFSVWTFPISAFLDFLLALILVYLFFEKPVYKPFIFRIILPATFCCCILFCISLIFKFLAVVLPLGPDSDISVSLPGTFIEWIFCILQFVFAAFTEEVFFRFYLPETLLTWCKDKYDKKLYFILIEIFSMFIFATGHFYLGFYSVLNAAVAQYILRFVYKKTHSIIPGFLAHFAYNIIFLILL